MKIKTLRKIVLTVVLLGGISFTAPTDVSAMCQGYNIDQQSYGGQCAPGGSDACGYFSSECDYYCFSHYSGNLCWSSFYLCDQYNAGSESSPSWCLDSGVCDCFYD